MDPARSSDQELEDTANLPEQTQPQALEAPLENQLESHHQHNDQSDDQENDQLNDQQQEAFEIRDLAEPGASASATPGAEQRAEPSLDMSREHSPETDYEGSVYSELARATPEPDHEGVEKGPTLNMGNAVKKRVRPDDVTYDPANPAGVTRETHKKRVTGRAIEKLWVPLEHNALRSFEKLCTISMTKTLERFEGASEQAAKVAETQRVLAQLWLSDSMAKSFLARLKVTKLPPLKSLQVRMRGAKPEQFDPLSIDEVRHRKAVFETYLLAELKQLDGLELYYQSLKTMYDLDLKYLSEFKRTTSSIQAQIAKERSQHVESLHLDMPDTYTDINLAERAAAVSEHHARARFDPNRDPDVKELLHGFQQELAPLRTSIRDLLGLCDELDAVQKALYELR